MGMDASDDAAAVAVAAVAPLDAGPSRRSWRNVFNCRNGSIGVVEEEEESSSPHEISIFTSPLLTSPSSSSTPPEIEEEDTCEVANTTIETEGSLAGRSDAFGTGEP